jgi:Tol biopolymer transport system component
VFVADVDFTAGTLQAPKLVSLRHDGKNRFPRWSRDGSQLAYASLRSAGWPPSGALVFQDPSTGQEKDVDVVALNFRFPPLWSPDLSKLVGLANVPGRGNQARALYEVDARTGQRSILIDHDAESGIYTKDGKHLIYRRHIWTGTNAGCQFVERDLRSGQERVILHRENNGWGKPLTLSPNGALLAYSEQAYSPTRQERTELLITSRTDGSTRAVWEHPTGSAGVVDWLPDNRRLLVSTRDKDDTQQLRIVDIETKSDRPFGPSLRRNDHIEQISVHPDGKRIAFSRGGIREEIWTMKNLVPKADMAARF